VGSGQDGVDVEERHVGDGLHHPTMYADDLRNLSAAVAVEHDLDVVTVVGTEVAGGVEEAGAEEYVRELGTLASVEQDQSFMAGGHPGTATRPGPQQHVSFRAALVVRPEGQDPTDDVADLRGADFDRHQRHGHLRIGPPV
jgi:hypothetical protein